MVVGQTIELFTKPTAIFDAPFGDIFPGKASWVRTSRLTLGFVAEICGVPLNQNKTALVKRWTKDKKSGPEVPFAVSGATGG